MPLAQMLTAERAQTWDLINRHHHLVMPPQYVLQCRMYPVCTELERTHTCCPDGDVPSFWQVARMERLETMAMAQQQALEKTNASMQQLIALVAKGHAA